MFLLEAHYSQINLGLGGGTNNETEFMVCKSLILYALEKGVTHLQVFGDSLLVINWLIQSQIFRNTKLQPLLDEILRLKLMFTSFSCAHIYREQNQITDCLSKEALQLDHGHW